MPSVAFGQARDGDTVIPFVGDVDDFLCIFHAQSEAQVGTNWREARTLNSFCRALDVDDRNGDLLAALSLTSLFPREERIEFANRAVELGADLGYYARARIAYRQARTLGERDDAIDWLTQARTRGNVHAAWLLSQLYGDQGALRFGVAPDRALELRWASDAADSGHARAASHVETMVDDGLGE